jgi:hypothetical protein
MHHPLFPVVSPSNWMNHHSRNLNPPWIHVGIFFPHSEFSLLVFFSCSLHSSSFFFFLFFPSSTITSICRTSLAIVSHLSRPLLPTLACFTRLANSKSPTHSPFFFLFNSFFLNENLTLPICFKFFKKEFTYKLETPS